MDHQQHDQEMSYPEPGSGYAAPYPEPSHAQDVYNYALSAPEEVYYPPMPQPLMHEGFMPRQPQPLMHEGYIPQEDFEQDSDVDEDPSAGYGELRAQFGLNFVLNPQSSHPDFSGQQQYQGGMVREGSYAGNPDFGLDQSQHGGAVQELVDSNNNPEIDPDFAMADEEDDVSSDDMSITSELLDDVLKEVEADNGNKRGRGGRGRAKGRGWKWALKGTEHDPKRGRGGTRGRPRGSRARGNGVPRGEGRRKDKPRNTVAEPDPEFRRLQALATQNFLSANWQAAADYARDAVKSNPEIFAAHSLLSEILLAQGKEHDSLTVLLHGAHTKRDPALWWHVGERTLELAGDNRTSAVLEQSIYCFAWAIKLDPDDYDARREKLNLLLETDQLPRARAECKMMVRQRPHDLNIVKQYADLCAISGSLLEIQKAKDAYDVAINFFFKGKSLGVPDTQWSHLNVYLDLVEKCENSTQAAFHLRKLSRWLLGRKEDTFWDGVQSDDREFDMDDVPRRIQIPEFKYSRFAGQTHMYGEGLPLELRVKLGLFRMKISRTDLPEAMQHFDHLLSLRDEVDEFHDLFRDVAEGLREQTYYAEAVVFYESIRSVPEACDHDYFMNLADCYSILNRNRDAESCWKFIVDNDPSDIKSRIQLAKLYEAEQRMAEAVPLVHDVIRLGRSDAVKKANISVSGPPPPRAIAPLPAKSRRPKPKPNHAGPVSRQYNLHPIQEQQETFGPEEEPDEEEEEHFNTLLPGKPRGRPKKPRPLPAKPKVSQSYERMQSIAPRIKANHLLLHSAKEKDLDANEDALETWMTAASEMIEDFRQIKVFYPGRDKHIKFTGYGRNGGKPAVVVEMEAMKRRIGGEDMEEEAVDERIPDSFHNIKFTEWLDIFCEYALRLSQADDAEKSYDILQAAHWASVFYHSPPAKLQIHATWLACALLLNDEQKICDVGRWFISEFPHSGSAYQLFASVNRLFSGYSNWFNSGPTQKFILRQVKSLDYALLDPEGRAIYAFTGQERSSYTQAGKRSPNPHGLKELDPGVLSLYGHIMAAAQSWVSALNYYFRVLTLEPDNAVINLCIATAYCQMGMKRQAENRHWQIYQGLAFLHRYNDLRGKESALSRQEAAYNTGRLWHLLGIIHLAVPEYEKALELSEQVRAEARAEKQGIDQRLAEGMMEGVVEEGQGDELGTEEFTHEAALALSYLYSANSNEAASRAIAEKWLVM